jgi:hypothetical protein
MLRRERLLQEQTKATMRPNRETRKTTPMKSQAERGVRGGHSRISHIE